MINLIYNPVRHVSHMTFPVTADMIGLCYALADLPALLHQEGLLHTGAVHRPVEDV